MRMGKHVPIVAVLLFLVACDSRETFVQLKMPSQNPMVWEFNASVPEIHAILKNRYSHRAGFSLEFANDTSKIVWGDEVLFLPQNKLDAFIFHYRRDTSYIYRTKEGGVEYLVSHHVHIDSIGPTVSRVQIIAVKPRICVGTRFPYTIVPRDPGATITVPVPPPTIEEYQLLLEIGDDLRVRAKMPALILPDTTQTVANAH